MSIIKYNNNVSIRFVVDLMTLFILQNKYLKLDKIKIIHFKKTIFKA